MRKKQPGESITNTVKKIGLSKEEKPFKLSLKGAQPKISDAPKSIQRLGTRIGNENEVRAMPNAPDPIGVSLDLRKKQPGEQITAVVPNKNKAVKDNVFKLVLKGGGPELKAAPKSNPNLGTRKGGPDTDQVIPKQPCPIELSIDFRKRNGSGSITDVIRGTDKKAAPDVVFKLSLKGAGPKLVEK